MEQSKDTVYSLIKGQCMGAFLAESIGRSDTGGIGPQAQNLLDKVESIINSQNGALSNLVTISISEKSSSNIFSTTSSTQYGRFVFLLAVTKSLTKYFDTENGEIAKKLVNEIQILLDDETFKIALFEDSNYQTLVMFQEETKSDAKAEKQVKSQSFLPYIGYGLGTLVIGGVAMIALSFSREKK